MIHTQMLHFWTQRLALLGLCAACASGCGKSGPALQPVSGVVTLDGSPLAGAVVAFDPASPEVRGRFIGKTDDQGRFSLGPPEEEGGGAPAGLYHVSFTTVVYDKPPLETDPVPIDRVPPQYRTGSMQFEVPEGGTDSANFDLKSR